MTSKTLAQIVAEKPFPEYGDWWPMGGTFLNFMSEAIVSQWRNLAENTGDLATISHYVAEYIHTVFQRESRPGLVEAFVNKTNSSAIQSGEFDALSYAFFRSTFELIEQHIDQYSHPLALEKRLYTKRVGEIFYNQMHSHLDLKLPPHLANPAQVEQLQNCIDTVGQFLVEQGYLRDHFRFTFAVNATTGSTHIVQSEADLLPNLKRHNLAYALYEMGYAVILPSAVYLYHTIGEAQHHSSRTIEALFDRIGYKARETDDFDPINYPSEMVVELWEITKLPT